MSAFPSKCQLYKNSTYGAILTTQIELKQQKREYSYAIQKLQ